MCTRFHWFLLIFLVLGNLLSAHGQNPYYVQYTSLNGLPSNHIFDLAVSSEGYLLIGTDEGLIKFDGELFTAIPFEAENNNIKSISITDLYQDHAGTVWCRNFSNQLFAVENQILKVQSWVNLEENEQVENLNENNGNVHIITNKRVIKVNHATKSQSTVFRNPFYAQNSIQSVVFTREGKLVIGLSEKIIIQGTPDVIVKTTLPKPKLVFFKGETVVVPSGDYGINDVFTISGNSLNLFTTVPGFSDRYNYFPRVAGDALWICSNRGIWAEDNGTFKSKLPAFPVSDIVQDRQGNFWLSTLGKGLLKIPDWNIEQVQFGAESPNITVLSPGPENTFFAGDTEGRIYWLNGQGEWLKTLKSDYKSPVEFISYLKKYNRIYTAPGYYNLETGKVFTAGLAGKNVSFDGKGNLFYAFHNGAFVIHENLTDPAVEYTITSDIKIKGQPTLINTRCKDIWFDTLENNVWIASVDGLYFGKPGDKLTLCKDESGKPIYPVSLAGVGNGELFVGTIQSGVYHIKQKKIFRHYSTADGLFSDVIRKIKISKGELNIITGKGINILDLQSGKLVNRINKIVSDDLEARDIFHNDLYWFVASGKGLLKARFHNQEKNNVLPLLRITDISDGDKTFNTTDKIHISPHAKNISIGFESINFSPPGDYITEYRLAPISKDWTPLPVGNRKVILPVLPAGDYTFSIRLRSTDAVYNLIVDEVEFTVNKPFWQRIYFWLPATLLLLFLAWVLLKYNNRRIRDKQKVKEELATSRLKTLRAQMNPHFLYNVLNSIQGYIYGNQKAKASEHLSKFSSLMRKILVLSEKERVSLSEEIDALDLYLELESARFDNDFSYSLTVSPEARMADPLIPPLLIQPFVENAVKHGLLHKPGNKELKVDVMLSENGRFLEVVIEDNGIGRKASEELNRIRTAKPESFAMKAIYSRIHLLSQSNICQITLNITDKIPPAFPTFGTRVHLKFSLHDEHKNAHS